MAALRRKSLALTRLCGQLIEQRLAGHGLNVVSPSQDGQRGSQVSLTRSHGAYAIVQALIERGVVGDFRAGDGAAHPDILRFGVCPLYTRYVDIWYAVDRLHQVMASGAWQEAKYGHQQSVT
jgi:kynureninase